MSIAIFRALWSARYALAIAAALTTAYFLGYHHAEQAFDAAEKRASDEAARAVIVDAERANAQSAVINRAIQTSDAAVDAERAKAAPRILTLKAQDAQVCRLSADDLAIDHDTVRLLNAAAQVPAAPTSASGNGAVEAPAGTSVARLVDYDFEVIKLYRELAIRHDSLVDFIESENKKRSGD